MQKNVNTNKQLNMKKLFFLIAITSLALYACRTGSSSTPVRTPVDGKWRMISVTDNASGTIITRPAASVGEVEINFASANITSGTFSGKTPANEIWQNEYVTGPGQAIAIPALDMTKVIETSWGNEFVNNIRDAKEFSIEADGRLNIKTSGKTLTFRKP
jgi:hypothetical protein